MRKKTNDKATKSPIALRRRNLADGRVSLFLDRYADGKHHYEFLQLYLLPETTKANIRANAKTLKEAERTLRQRCEDIINAKADAKKTSRLTLEALFARFSQKKSVSKNFVDSLSNTINTIERFRPGIYADEVDRDFCLAYIDWLKNEANTIYGKKYSQSSVKSYCSYFSATMRFAVTEGIIEKNPWEKLDRSEKPRKGGKVVEYLTINELKSMIANQAGSENVRRGFLFSCFCGLRLSDVRALQWRDITRSGENWQVCIRMKKTDTPIYLPLPKQAVNWIPIKENPQPDDIVFEKLPEGCSIAKTLKKWTELAGVKKHITFHCARHTFATMMLTLGVDIYTVSKMLGHKKVETSQIYAEIINEKKQAAVSNMERAFNL